MFSESMSTLYCVFKIRYVVGREHKYAARPTKIKTHRNIDIVATHIIFSDILLTSFERIL